MPKAADPQTRFWAKVTTGEGCWEWTAGTNRMGYGLFNRATRPSRCVLAHRFAYESKVGPIPDGVCVLHRCDNPRCVRPDHLFLGDRTDNANDKVAKGRQAGPKGEAHPRHKLTAEQVTEIRRVYSAGGITKAELARRYGVKFNAIRGVVTGRSWRHVTEGVGG